MANINFRFSKEFERNYRGYRRYPGRK